MANGMQTTPIKHEALRRLGRTEYLRPLPRRLAMAGDTPFKYFKQTVQRRHRDPLIVHWPKAQGEGWIRSQLLYITDIAPTILEPRARPFSTRWTPQADGARRQSLAYSFDNGAAPTQHAEQLYEMFGNRAIYKEAGSREPPRHIACPVVAGTFPSRGTVGALSRRRGLLASVTSRTRTGETRGADKAWDELAEAGTSIRSTTTS